MAVIEPQCLRAAIRARYLRVLPPLRRNNRNSRHSIGPDLCNNFRILRRHQMVIRDQTKLHEDAKTLSRSRKSAAIILQVVVLFFLFYSPCVYATISFNVTKNFNIGQNSLWEITETVALMNASVNPLLYYWKMESIRRAVKNLFCTNQVHFLERTTEF